MLAVIRVRLLVALVVLPALAALLAFAAFSPEAEADHSWGNYHWARTANPFLRRHHKKGRTRDTARA